MKLILASQSPRRRELMSLLGLDFLVVPAVVDETPQPGESPSDYVTRLAVLKARRVGIPQNAETVVVAADTAVVDGDQILGKPVNPLEAEVMLRQLRGRVHQVYTGIAVESNARSVSDVCDSDVPMRHFTDDELNNYIKTGDPFDKAGGYGIQHAGFHPVGNFQGCYANVMGMPLCHLTRSLRKLGLDTNINVPAACQAYIGYHCLIFGKILEV
jgi:septum formation protein